MPMVQDNASTPACNPDDDGEHDGVRILIVENTTDVAKYIRRQLNPQYHYYFAANGREGLEKATELVPDVIITDVMMPEMGGFELTEHIRLSELLNHIPVIIVTAKATHEDRMRGLETGADAYLEKPFHADELNVRVEKLLEQRRLLQKKFMSPHAGFINEAKPEEATEGAAEISPAEESMAPVLTEKNQSFVDKFSRLVLAQMADGKVNYEALASDMFLCRAQLSRKLKTITGMTLTECVFDIRIAQAKRLLADTDLSVADIDMQCGIDNPPYFSQLFRKATGLTPQQFRKGS